MSSSDSVTSAPSAAGNWRRTTAVAIVVLAGALALFPLAGRVLPAATVANHDFISYWSAAKILAAHGNPYDQAAVMRLELQQGAAKGRPWVMRNPPWTLFLTVPLAWFDASQAAVLWMLAILAAALGSLQLLRPGQSRSIPLTILFFAPTLICVGAGQTSLFVLLGIALFVRNEKRRPFIAGLALALTMLKPHLLVLFWVALILESWRCREGRVIAGLTCGVGIGSALATVLDPHIWVRYFASMHAEKMDVGFYPTVSCLLRYWLAERAIWPEAIPTIAGLIWVVWYWRRRRHQWQWTREGALVMAASVLVAPYAWILDQVLFIPALLFGLARAPRWAGIALAGLNVCALVTAIRIPVLGSLWYLWTAPVWMLWCAYAYSSASAAESRIPGVRSQSAAEVARQSASMVRD